jgi:HD-GYP domain-containing protein (c-di-GMP phosphodiesterase class II)
MRSKREIWYYRDSPAASLAKSLRGRYALRALPGTGRGGRGDSPKRPADGALVVCLADLERDDLAGLSKIARRGSQARLVGLASDARKRGGANGWQEGEIFAYLPRKVPRPLLEKTIDAAFSNLELAERERAAREELEQTRSEMEELNRIGVALSSEREIGPLLDLILQKMREITNADAGSLYLAEEEPPGQRHLRFKLTQNDSRQFPFTEFVVPITEESMAGYVALHGEPIHLPDAYSLPPDRPYGFNAQFDRDSGYRTRSILTVPMKNAKGEVLGVLQLINCKRHRAARLDSPEAVEREVRPFPESAVRLALSLGSQAAVAYENRKLYEEIEALFEGFVQAAVIAIEQRDPTTSGHSFRVSTLTVSLAETVDRTTVAPYGNTHFTQEQMKEIHYAALLHDFGKVGVREEVLVKAKKLYPMQLELVQQRFDYVRKDLEARVNWKKLQCLLERGREQAYDELVRLDEEYRRRVQELDEYLQFILRVNEPTVLPQGESARLAEISQFTYVDPRGIERNFLRPEELRFLSVAKGSLDENERLQIQSHVVHTFHFLNQIPWTKEIQNIPWIARAHHEKLNGTGYPYKLKADEIPFQAKMMTICDIFDALTASDRPYKKAVPVERALNILEQSVHESELDANLFRLFLEAGIYRLTVRQAS